MKKKLILAVLALCLTASAVVGMAIVTHAKTYEKNGTFNGSPAHVNEEGYLYLDETNFPDENFRKYVSAVIDTYPDFILSPDEVNMVTEIDCSEYGIHDLSGIEFFTSLTYLKCSGNALTELDISNNIALKWLECDRNELTSLDVSNNTSLTDLACGSNKLTTLDVSACTNLDHILSCSDNMLTSLVLGNKVFFHFDCANNYLTSSGFPQHVGADRYFNCSNNLLTELDISASGDHSEIYCSDNTLVSLKVKNASVLNCSNNNLTELNLSDCGELEILRCSNNALTALDVSACPWLSVCVCDSQKYPNAVTLTRTDNGCIFDMAEFLGDYASLVVSIDGSEYAPDTGIATFTELPEKIDYVISLLGYDATMDVTLTNITVEGGDEPTSPEDNTLTDTDSGIEVEYPSDKSDYYEDVTLVVETVGDDSEASIVVSGKFGDFIIYDINLVDADGVAVQPDGTVKVRIPVPEDWNAADIAVYHVSEDGIMTKLDTTVSDGYITFETDHFSLYALVNTSTAVTDPEPPVTEPEPSVTEPAPGTDSDDVPKTADITSVYTWLVVLGVSVIGLSAAAASLDRKRKHSLHR